MENDRSSGENKPIPKHASKVSRSKVLWKDTGIDTFYVDLGVISSNREEISLLFGHNPVRDPSQNTVKVESANRICLNPFVAKRLAVALDETIRDYELKYGTIALESNQSTLKCPSSSSDTISGLSVKKSRKSDLLFDLTNKLNVTIGVESSFKLFKGSMLTNRFLLGFNKADLWDRPHGKVLEICRQISMPENYIKTFQKNIDEANIVLFGFEENEENSFYKAYLEFGGRFETTFKENPGRDGRFILHQGFKWDSIENTHRAFANYTCFPLYSIEDMRRGLASILHGENSKGSLEIAEGLLEKAAGRKPHHELLYLEVTEEDNLRKSFDLNIYRADFRMEELYPWLLKMCQVFSIPLTEFHELYEPVKTQKFGHLSGGIDRKGREFLTVYYGVKGSTGD